ncbi:archease [Candidatus Woesearchaeota archaeon]|jgi:SHS2 domain-containing protein|nr:archease [Candidatus Woesearchaeota archaeon]MBT4336803.1 archease [Candidatus Woesearchaeota archaeon]MBT4469471.1 archease [Candidatus Woesearchaeota archaeon]MBT6744134.1 archease [Candidatus Woesearchaeota archaeon]
MKANYKFLEHTADELFVAEASTLGELFEQCGLAVEEVQVNLKQFSAEQKREITGENENIEYLLFDFLDDLLFHKDSERIIFSKFDCKVTEENGKYKLTCIAYGEKIDPEKHEQKVDIKAITMHMFEVKKTDKGWYAKVLVDI